MMRRKAGDVRIRVRFFALLAGALAAGCSSTQTNEPSDPSWRDAEAAYLTWIVTLQTDQGAGAVRDVFEFVDGANKFSVSEIQARAKAWK